MTNHTSTDNSQPSIEMISQSRPRMEPIVLYCRANKPLSDSLCDWALVRERRNRKAPPIFLRHRLVRAKHGTWYTSWDQTYSFHAILTHRGGLHIKFSTKFVLKKQMDHFRVLEYSWKPNIGDFQLLAQCTWRPHVYTIYNIPIYHMHAKGWRNCSCCCKKRWSVRPSIQSSVGCSSPKKLLPNQCNPTAFSFLSCEI